MSNVTDPDLNDSVEAVVWGSILGCPWLLIFGGVGALVGWLISHQTIGVLIGAVMGLAVLLGRTRLSDWLSFRSWKKKQR